MDERNQQHKTLLLEKIPEASKKPIIILDISNDYLRHDPELERILREKLRDYLKSPQYNKE